jgi:hypothetical protein
VKLGSTGDQHNIYGVNYLFVAIQPSEAVVIVNKALLGLRLLNSGSSTRDTLGKEVAHGDKSHTWIGIQGVPRGTRSPTTTTDDTDLDGVAAGRMGTTSE